MFKPRQYQSEGNEQMRDSIRKGNRRIVYVIPTGGGKTVTIMFLLMEAIKKGHRPCILVPRNEIFEQFESTLREFGIRYDIIVAGKRHYNRSTQLFLGMVETFWSRFAKYGQKWVDMIGIDMLVFDEAHFGNYSKILRNVNSIKWFIGLTGTPVLTETAMSDLWDDMVEPVKISSLIDDGWLVKPELFSIKHEFKFKVSGDDFRREDVEREFMENNTLYEGAVKNFLRIAPDSHCICFGASVKKSIATTEMFLDSGISAAHIDAKTEDGERKEIIRRFRNREIQVLCNVGIATNGFDEKKVDCVIQDFATASIVKHMQTAGRGGRSCDGKSKFTLIDMGRNFSRHGYWESDIDWRWHFGHKSKADTEEKIAGLCARCGYVNQLTSKSCGNCLEPLEIADKIPEKKKKVSKKKQKEVEVQRIYNSLPKNLKKPISSMTFGELKEYARRMGYKANWVFSFLNNRHKHDDSGTRPLFQRKEGKIKKTLSLEDF